jgi:DNA-directed RNA polymerase subunit RPC12/RpoP
MAESVFNCPHCGGAVQCDSQYAGQTVACPHCQGGIIVPAEGPSATPDASSDGAAACIGCGAPIEEGAVLCMKCGMNQETGVSVLPAAGESKAEPLETPAETTVEAPAEAPESADEPADDELVIKFNCPGCGEELEIPESMLGEPVGCPDCGIEVTKAVPVPKPQTGSKKVVLKKKTIMPVRKGG